MKIVCVIKTSQGATWLVRQAETMVARGHEVTVLLPSADGPLGAGLRSAGAAVRAAPTAFGASRLPWLLPDLSRMRAMIREERPQVLFYQLWASAVMARLSSIGLTGLRRVHMVPGPLYLDTASLRALERVFVRLDDLVIAGSRYTAGRYRRLGLPPPRLTMIPYGVDLRRFQPADAGERVRARDALGIAPDAFVVVMVALVYGGKRLVHGGRPIKGHEDLLRAWRRFHPAGREKHLVMVGDGFDNDGRRHRRHLMHDFDVEVDPSISWLPTVDDVRPYYAAADISVSPSLSENHGAAVEAAAMGVPSIVSDAGGLPEVVEGSGWIFPAGDERALLVRLFEAASVGQLEMDERRRASRRQAEAHFDAEACLDRLVTLLEREAERMETARQ